MVVLASMSLVKTPPQCFYAERDGDDIQEEYALHITGEDARLDGCPEGHCFVGIDTLIGLFAEKVPYQLLDAWHPGRTPDQDDFVDVFWGELGSLEGFAAGF